MAKRVPPKRVVIIGAGGVGFWVTVSLMREVGTSIPVEVYDPDNFDGGTGARRLPIAGPYMAKVAKLDGFIRYVMGDVGIRKYMMSYTGYSAKNYDLVVDCSDMSIGSRREIWEKVRAKNARILRVSYDGNGVVTVSRGLPFGPDQAIGYSRIPTMPQSLVAGGIGADAILRILSGEEFEEDRVYRINTSEVDEQVAETIDDLNEVMEDPSTDSSDSANMMAAQEEAQ